MFNLFKKQNKNEIIYSPIKGKVVDSSLIPDDTFKDEILGPGVAIEPAEGKVYSPVDGELTLVIDTKHAMSITSDKGTEILLHIGIDTVNLKGEPFKVHVEQGSKIKKGDLLMEFDINQITDAGLSIISPVVICNADNYKEVKKHINQEVTNENGILEIVS